MKRLICTFYAALLAVMGLATFVESAEGTPFAHRHIYGTWWFAAMWAVLAVAGAIYIIMSRERRLAVLALHASFATILCGALLTHLVGRSGTLHLRVGEPQDVVEIDNNGERYLHRLAFKVELADFQVVEDEEGRVVDYRSEFTVGDERAVVSMNNIHRHGNLRFYQMSYDRDLRGSTLLVGRDPWGIPVTYAGYALLFVSFVSIAASGSRLSRRRIATAAVALLLTGAWCLYYFVLDGSWSQIPVLRSPLLVFHVVIIIMAYALLLIQTALSAWALARRSGRIVSVMNPALCLLSIGIFLGAVWANISWGNYWSWDSKETWALITLMIYAVPCHKRSLPAFRNPLVYNWYMVAAFLTVLMTYFGVNYFLTGMHSYN